jgi:hypothetical protein
MTQSEDLNVCRVCGDDIKVMCYKNTGFCCLLHEKQEVARVNEETEDD